MFRTRDYFLMLATIVCLMVGISTTLLTGVNFGNFGPMSANVFETTPPPETYEATVVEKVAPSREERIASLREKIAALGFVSVEEPEPIKEESPLPIALEEETGDVKEERCAGYQAYAGAWSPQGLLIAEVEGARLVYREVATEPLGSSTVPTIKKSIALQLPVRSVPGGAKSCVASDVIGIAKGGSLIRNSEVGVYGVFGADTLVGYALDGFPIYGSSDSKTDVCGGIVIGGQYRYQINPDRETIINCFAGTPVSL